MNCTCSLVAAPVPTIAFFTSAGGNSWIVRPARCSGQQDDPACVAERERGAHVARVEDVLDRDRDRAMPRDQLGDPVVDLAQRDGERSRGLVRITPHSTSLSPIAAGPVVPCRDAQP